MRLTIPIRTGTGLNSREHWAVRAKRVKRERNAVALLWPKHTRYKAPLPPIVVNLVRLKPRGKALDLDNLQGSLKAIRDEVAKQLGVDDGGNEVVWEYGQEKGPWGVRVELSPA